MDYKSLKTLFHMHGITRMEAEYEQRKRSHGAFFTDIVIHPIQGEVQQREARYPLFFLITKELVIKLERVLKNSAKIQRQSLSQPEIANDAYIKYLLINELQSTNEAENIKSTKNEIAAALNNTKNTNKRFDGLVNLYLMLKNKEIEINTIGDIRRIFDTLVSNEVELQNLPDGDMFRNKAIGIYDQSKAKWIHRNEFNEREIIEYLTLLLAFIKHDPAPELYKMMASHFIFEYIHPFYDGNGRVGRFILAKLLNNELDSYTALTFSYIVNQKKYKYYKAFENASNAYNKGELTHFIEAMLDIVLEGQESVVTALEKNIEMITRLRQALELYDFNKYEYNVLFVLLQDKVFGSSYSRITLKELKNVVGFSRNKINEVVASHRDKLIKLNSNPVVYEIKNEYIDVLLSQELS
ncbi:Fic family protein [Staphylococcus caeli]|uniref:Fic family protein n=1 Tax=Staphylococcus caeli TaxID=2201815 RepID=UPI003F54C269